MDSIGDYIYLIIIIIAALSGIFKKNKPKTVPQTTMPEIDEIDEMEEPFFQDIKTAKGNETNYQPLSFDTATDFSKLKAQKQVVITSKFTNTNEVFNLQPEEAAEIEYKFETSEDVKKAVIYSEIFNRKYQF